MLLIILLTFLTSTEFLFLLIYHSLIHKEVTAIAVSHMYQDRTTCI